jgi:hypothetical protein
LAISDLSEGGLPLSDAAIGSTLMGFDDDVIEPMVI